MMSSHTQSAISDEGGRPKGDATDEAGEVAIRLIPDHGGKKAAGYSLKITKTTLRISEDIKADN